jgi:hypothetical protein
VIADRLESVLERLETALAARETENLRLRAVETAAAAALTELNDLIGDAEARRDGAGDTTPARRAEHR